MARGKMGSMAGSTVCSKVYSKVCSRVNYNRSDRILLAINEIHRPL